MSFLLHDSLSEIGSAELNSPNRTNSGKQSASSPSRVTLIEAKLRLPAVPAMVTRDRLLNLLDRSSEQYGATLVSGRAGTGKTTLAVKFASRTESPSWYTIEPTDSDWREFSAAFRVCLFGKQRANTAANVAEPDDAVVSDYLTSCFARLGRRRIKPRLIVLDNVHHLFDAEWFSGFFRQLITSLDANVRLLMLCRSKPNGPLWRLRSKQMLNIIDETMLDLTEEEALAIGRDRGVSDEQILFALRRSYGRVGTFSEILQRKF